jgi:hypothetical protein
MRFLSQGAEVLPTVTVYSGATVYAQNDYVSDGGITYRSLQLSNGGHTPASSPLWWIADSTLAISTPWPAADIWALKFTQSADVMYFTHPDHKPRELRRLSPNSFEMRTFTNRDGPFLDLNTDEAVVVAASGVQGTVTLTASAPIFTADDVGGIFYIEPQDLGQVRPWVVAERSISVGTLRRSDGKTYRATRVAGGGSWHETGPRTPVHESGRVWDGAGDTKTNGVETWSVGVEWEYVDSGFGVVEITVFNSTTSVDGLVTKRLPEAVVGGVGTPSSTWNDTGDGVSVSFPIAGATAGGVFNVTVGGVPVQSDPNYTPPVPVGGTGGAACVAVDAVLPGGRRAGDVRVGDSLLLFDPVSWTEGWGVVTYSQERTAPIWRLTTAGGVVLDCSSSAPIPVRGGGYRTPEELVGFEVPIWLGIQRRWDMVVDAELLGEGLVQHITVGDRCFWAGNMGMGYLLHHNAKQFDPVEP